MQFIGSFGFFGSSVFTHGIIGVYRIPKNMVTGLVLGNGERAYLSISVKRSSYQNRLIKHLLIHNLLCFEGFLLQLSTNKASCLTRTWGHWCYWEYIHMCIYIYTYMVFKGRPQRYSESTPSPYISERPLRCHRVTTFSFRTTHKCR